MELENFLKEYLPDYEESVKDIKEMHKDEDDFSALDANAIAVLVCEQYFPEAFASYEAKLKAKFKAIESAEQPKLKTAMKAIYNCGNCEYYKAEIALDREQFGKCLETRKEVEYDSTPIEMNCRSFKLVYEKYKKDTDYEND